MNRWSNFTDAELYILKRMAMESSWNICMEKNYSEPERLLHNDLLNELTTADSDREYGQIKQGE